MFYTTDEKRSREERNSSIELLRILMAISVIILHWNINGGIDSIRYPSEKVLAYFSEAVAIVAVDVFVILGGVFLSQTYNRNIGKVLSWLIEIEIISAIVYLISIFYNSDEFLIIDFIKSMFPHNYFMIFYAVLYIVSPYINFVLNYSHGKGRKRMLTIMMLTFSIYPTFIDAMKDLLAFNVRDLSTIARDGSEYGYTIVNFVLLYIIGANIWYYRNLKVITKYIMLWLMLIMITACSGYFFDTIINNGRFSLNFIWSYCNPLIIFMSSLLVLIFINLKMTFSKIINVVASSCLTVYLIHGYILTFIPMERIFKMGFGLRILIISLLVVAIFALSILVDASMKIVVFSRERGKHLMIGKSFYLGDL